MKRVLAAYGCAWSTLLIACSTQSVTSDAAAPDPSDAGTGADSHSPVADAAPTIEASLPIDCKTMEQLTPGYESDVVPHTYAAGPRPEGPHASPRAIENGRVYRRTKVAQYGGTEDKDAPLPTLIKFTFTEGSNQLSGEYCVVQATKGKDGGPVSGHYEMSFVPKSPGSSTDFVVNVTMKPPSTGKFPIGFDGTKDELTLSIDTGATSYLETYQLVP